MVNTEIRLIIFFAAKWRSSIQSTKTRLGADCGSDHELLITKFRLKLKKVGKTPRPFRYDPNQIRYDYTMEVRNRFMGLNLIDRLPDNLWNEVHDVVQETGIKTIAGVCSYLQRRKGYMYTVGADYFCSLVKNQRMLYILVNVDSFEL